jgi:hypothetical protein
MRGFMFAALFGLVSALAFAKPPVDDNPVTLRRVYKAGDVSRYATTMRVKVMGNEFVQESVDKIEVKKVDPDGTAGLTYEIESGSYILNGNKNDLPKAPPWAITRDKQNRFVKATTEETFEVFMAPEVRRLLFSCVEVVFPDKPVKVGDTWTTELDNPAVKGKKITLKTTFRGKEMLEGASISKVEQRAEADTNLTGGKLTCDLTAWLNGSTGEAVKIETAFKGVPTQFGALDTNSVSVLKKPGEKPGA